MQLNAMTCKAVTCKAVTCKAVTCKAVTCSAMTCNANADYRLYAYENDSTPLAVVHKRADRPTVPGSCLLKGRFPPKWRSNYKLTKFFIETFRKPIIIYVNTKKNPADLVSSANVYYTH